MNDTNAKPVSLDSTAAAEQAAGGRLSDDLLSILRCPITLSRLRQEGDWLIAEIGGLAFPVRDGIPVMLAEEARLPAGIASLDEFKSRFSRG